ncbi:hypothetical protein SFUMM280S_00501 [Streptomyces fumanus]
MLGDPATWRDLCWLVVDMTAGFGTALLPAALLLYRLEGFAIAAGLWRVLPDSYWYGFVRVTGQAAALGAAALAAALLVAAYLLVPALLRGHFLLTRAVLGSGSGELAERVRVLTETRRDAVDTSAAELRRIERDLHDGAQARLIAMGMDLGTAEALLDKDPAKARQVLARARRSSADALDELRDLVRGIHPPVLAERGLGDAVRALALRLPVTTEVTVQLPGRAGAPVESAAYFAVSEVLTNAVKHSGADRIWVDLHHTDGFLRIAVTDNGRGGAVIGAGSGLSGVERRLGTFDGVLACVWLPRGRPHHGHHGDPLRVVLAEDLFLLRDGLARWLLEAHGFQIAAAVESGPELTRALAELDPDVAVVDVRLPPTHTDEGLQCALRARQERPGMPVLVLSQHVEQLYARELLADGGGGVG